MCGPAIGKTYLASIDDRFYDLDGEKAKYKYNLYNLTSDEMEYGKLNRGPIINDDLTKWAINKLHEKINDKKCVLISYSKKIINYINENKIDYCLFFASKNSRDEYRKRMKKRNNSDTFIINMTNEESWNDFYINNVNDKNAKYKIELQKEKYLSNIKDYFIL